GVILLMHGYRSSGLNDFNLVFPYYQKLGYHLIIPDQRACGRSEGKYITLGIKERFDCQAWANFAAKEFGEDIPLILDGISMGSSTVMMASALPLPKNVSGIVADCGFTSPDEVVRAVLKATHIPTFPNLFLARMLARTLAKFDFTDASSIDAMKQCHYPIIFIHGKKDDFVPYEMSVRNFEACASEHKKFFSDDNAGHGMCYLERREELQQELENFLNECQQFYHQGKDI
ncbi:MAG: alpha/beta hydrolase, partial [Clostridia bacterium]|nr:alpha/beta hydrolase [Clostridia bacterium]